MMVTMWVVPILAISFCLGSSSTISLACSRATFLTRSASAGRLVSTLTPASQRATSAVIPLWAKTVPTPPRPACL